MKLLKSLVCLSAIVFGLTSLAAPAGRVGDFTLLDHLGKSHQLRWYGDQKAVVIIVQANGSAVLRNSAAQLKVIRDEFVGQGVTFFMLNPIPGDSRASIVQEAAARGYDLPILLDETQLIAETLGVGRVGEALVISPENMTLAYQGPIGVGAASGLRDALESVLAGREVAANGTVDLEAGLGDAIVYQSRDAHLQNPVSYVRDIVPILENNCVACHHDGAIGSWSMSNHAMVRGWSTMMREVLLTRRMPPGQIDPHVGRPIAGVAGLEPEEMQKLVHWIDAGAPTDAGDDDPLTALTFDDHKFSLGEPDLVFKVPAQTIPATGLVDYRYVPVQLNLDRDIWVRAMEFVPGDRKVLHHIIAYLSSPADKNVRGQIASGARDDSVGGFAPGRQPDAFRDNSGRLIRKGSSLLLQMHYTTNGRETVDATEVGIYLHQELPAHVMAGGVAAQRRFVIPPYAKEHELVGEQLLDKDAYLYSMTPHMHFRGKYMSYSAVYPDGRSELLLSVPRYDFNWQFSYELAEPVFLPAGTRLVTHGAMDNSERNSANPDPSKPVYYGLQTQHEMFFGFTTFRYVGETPETLTGKSPAAEDEVAGL